MITYAAFGALRLRQFVDPNLVEILDDWEFMGRLWVGEAFGFSEFLRLRRRPRVLRSLSIDLLEFPTEQAQRVLALLGLPLAPGMSREQVDRLLGEPVRTLNYAPDRVTYEYVTDGRQPYEVSCTLREDVGLAYINVKRPRRSVRLRRTAGQQEQVPLSAVPASSGATPRRRRSSVSRWSLRCSARTPTRAVDKPVARAHGRRPAWPTGAGPRAAVR